MQRNKYDIDETLETPFSLKHLFRALVYVNRHKGKLLAAVVLSLIASACSLLGPYLMKIAVDQSVPRRDVRQLILLAGIMGAAVIISVAFTTLRSILTAQVGQDVIFEIRQDLFAHLQKLPFAYYDSRPHGKILVRVIQYVNSVSDMLSNGIINFFLEIFNLVLIVIFMLQVDVRLTMVVLAGLPFLLVILTAVKPAQRRAWQSISNKSSNLNAYVHESINGMRVTQIFTRERENHRIFHRLCTEYRDRWMRAVYLSNLMWYSVQNISQIVFSMVYITGVDWSGAVITFGTVLAMGNYASRFWQPITNLANIYNNFLNTIAYLERIFETIDEPVAIQDAPGATALPPITGAVTFDHVDFAYDADTQVLRDMNFTVRPGESIALVGPTGAGKSTVVSLISRFYDVTGGRVLIDGSDIAEVTLDSLRSQMGIMLQDSFIFSGTIMDNIRYGRLDATDEEVVRAAQVVRADDFIAEMEKGYLTEVNERGSRLSQGQKQLISFARTLLADPKILVLDEATSSIDTRTERLLQEGLGALLKGRTSFIIAHRLSTIQSCDRILYIDGGQIVEAGSHAQLMARRGAYYSLFMAQMSA